MNILGSNYGIINPASGFTKAGTPADGTLYQFNNGQVDKKDIGASLNGSIHDVFAGDSMDTFNLTGGWQNEGYGTDQTTGISGHLFKSASGDEILISGAAKLTGDYSGSSDSPQFKGNLGQAADQISHSGQWEAVTGGDHNATLTLDQAKARLTQPGLSANTQAALQAVVDGWGMAGFSPTAGVTLAQMQARGLPQ